MASPVSSLLFWLIRSSTAHAQLPAAPVPAAIRLPESEGRRLALSMARKSPVIAEGGILWNSAQWRKKSWISA